MKKKETPSEPAPRAKATRGKKPRKRKMAPVGRARWLLGHLIQMTGLGRRDVDERLGLTRGQVSQLLTGRVSLKLEMILLILDEVGMEPAMFFKLLFELPDEGDNPFLALLYRKMLESGAMKPEHLIPPPEPAPIPADQLRRLVREELQDVLALAQRTPSREDRLAEERKLTEPLIGDIVEEIKRKRAPKPPRKKSDEEAER
ncbi:MAG: hypothetical protein ABJC13_09225 [Acidobacteriota bacterium]